MRRRTRRRRRKTVSINKIAFFCLMLSIIIVCGVFSIPTKATDNGNKQNTDKAYSAQAETATYSADKNKSEIQNTSNILSGGYSDIAKAENSAKELLDKVSDNGKIFSADYSSKNATSALGSLYVRNTTKNSTVNFESYLKRKITANISKNKPVVLVYHTHSSESYQITENTFYSDLLIADPQTLGVIRAGDALCNAIEAHGYEVIHDRTVYDTSYSGAFDRSRNNISDILRANPSIQIVIDLHRDSITRKDGSRVKTVTEIDGKKTAQIQIITGCEEGAVKGFPNWEKNLTFALKLQKSISDYNPRAVRPLLFCTRKYNMDLVPCALNIEIGTDANTVREAVYSAEILGNSISELIKECEKK